MAVRYQIPYRDADNTPWRIDISDKSSTNIGFLYTLSEQTSPSFIDGNLIIKDLTDGREYTQNVIGGSSFPIPIGHRYQVVGFSQINYTDDEVLRMTLYKTGVPIYDKQIPANATDILLKEGITQPGETYFVNVSTYNTTTPVIPIDIPDINPVPNRQVIVVRANGHAGVLNWQAENTDDHFSTFIKSSCTINIYKGENLDIRELQRAHDFDFKVEVFKSGSLYWVGYLDPQGIQKPMQSIPHAVTLTAKDGLGLLSGIAYTHADLPGLTDIPAALPINYIRQILFAPTNLGLPLPIRWTNDLECLAYPDQDVYAGSVQWSANGEGYIENIAADGTRVYKNCEYILRGLLEACQCRIYQAGGRWNIRRIPDIASGYVVYKQIPATLNTRLEVQEARELMTKHIGRSGYPFVNEDQIETNSPGIKRAVVTYDGGARDNILPNGNFDLYNDMDKPIYWGDKRDRMTIERVNGLDGRKGSAVKLTPGGDNSDPYNWYEPTEPLPIDTKILIARINFSFLFSAVSWYTGGPTPSNPSGIPADQINWYASPFHIQLVLSMGSVVYYLNQYGYWTTDETEIDIVVDGLRVGEVASVKFDKFQGIIMPEPPNELKPGDTCELSVRFRSTYTDSFPQVYILDNVSVSAEANNDVYECYEVLNKNAGIDERTMQISSSFGGYLPGNLQTSYAASDEEFYFRDGLFYEGSLTGLYANAIMRLKHNPSIIYNGSMKLMGKPYDFDQMYTIDSFGDTKFMPLNATYDTEAGIVNNLIAIECKNDNAIFTEKFYGSNDNILTN